MKGRQISESDGQKMAANASSADRSSGKAVLSPKRNGHVYGRDQSGRELLLWTLAYIVILALLILAAALSFSD